MLGLDGALADQQQGEGAGERRHPVHQVDGDGEASLTPGGGGRMGEGGREREMRERTTANNARGWEIMFFMENALYRIKNDASLYKSYKCTHKQKHTHTHLNQCCDQILIQSP